MAANSRSGERTAPPRAPRGERRASDVEWRDPCCVFCVGRSTQPPKGSGAGNGEPVSGTPAKMERAALADGPLRVPSGKRRSAEELLLALLRHLLDVLRRPPRDVHPQPQAWTAAARLPRSART